MQAPTTIYDVIIIGGSYAGLSAALALGRSLRKVLVIDSDNACNKKAAYSHNFLTRDHFPPSEIKRSSREQALTYPTTSCIDATAVDLEVLENGFNVHLDDKSVYTGRKVLFATGVTDLIPNIPGFSECWGISILHCPYCHGYENKHKTTAVIGNGDQGFVLAKTIHQWSNQITLYTNGTSTLNPEEVFKLNRNGITVIQNDITHIEHNNGNVTKIHFDDASAAPAEVIYVQLPFKQQCDIPEKLGVTFTEKGFIQVTRGMETSIPGIFAAGDCLSFFRSVAHAIASGNKAGAIINKCLIDEDF